MPPTPLQKRKLTTTHKVGWGSTQPFEPSFGGAGPGAGGDLTSVKAKMINLINSVRTLMRIPLIFLNILIIIWAIAFG
jgi:hypothetical protein